MFKYSNAKSPRSFGFLVGFVFFVIFASLYNAEEAADQANSEYRCILPSKDESTTCSWKSKDPIKKKIEEAEMSWVAKVKRTMEDEERTRIYQKIIVTKSELEVVCILKGGEVPGHFQLTKTGFIIARCFDLKMKVGEMHLINVNGSNKFYCSEVTKYENHEAEIASLCHLNFTYPRAVTTQRHACPTKADSCSKDRGVAFRASLKLTLSYIWIILFSNFLAFDKI